MGRNFHVLGFRLFTIISALCLCSVNGELNIYFHPIDKWLTNFSKTIEEIVSTTTAKVHIKLNYHGHVAVSKRPKGMDLVRNMTQKMSKLLRKKRKAVENISEAAERFNKTHHYDPSLELTYYNAKKILSTDDVKRMGNISMSVMSIDLKEDPAFVKIPINLDYSTVHVPTNVYEKSPRITNGIQWSEKLDRTFKHNRKVVDPSLTWQYFCSSDGFFRVFPGLKWMRNTERGEIGEVDMFDGRMREWYVRAASFPKTVLILLDVSGSMKGLRMQIARSTVIQILETLTDDDVFNVIKFSNTFEYADPCFNATLVPASAENIHKMKKSLEDLKAKYIANFEKVLVESFELLNSSDLCNKALMILTDGAPENFEWVFEKYNWPNKTVRVFTYLIGKEVKDNRQVKWMACANKGYYKHISTKADVREHVQEYIHVLSRTMVMNGHKREIYTPAYLDYNTHFNLKNTIPGKETVDDGSQKPIGFGMMVSVAVPVFDIRNETHRDGTLLGVAGTDIPILELTKFTPPWELGVNGYAFMITKNGYTVFHPEYRPIHFPVHHDSKTVSRKVKPFYKNVDINEVEMPVDFDDFAEIRDRMIQGKTGKKRTETKHVFDRMKRVTVRKNEYYFAPINGSFYSMCIVLPQQYGRNFVDPEVTLPITKACLTELSELCQTSYNRMNDYGKYHDALVQDSVILAKSWNYCNAELSDFSEKTRIQEILYYANRSDYVKYCNKELLRLLLFDAYATSELVRDWESHIKLASSDRYRLHVTGYCYSNQIFLEVCVESIMKSEGIQLVFYGAQSGLVRYKIWKEEREDAKRERELLKEEREEINFLKKKPTIESLYYKKTVDSWNDNNEYTISVPYLNRSLNSSSILLTITTPLVIERDGRSAVAGVMGIQMAYPSFHKLFYNIVNNDSDQPNQHDKNCQERPCPFVCSSEEMECYLIDNNGYIVAHNRTELIGEFLGAVDIPMMDALIHKEVFHAEEIINYQAMCDMQNSESEGNSASSLVTPLKTLLNFIVFLFSEISMFIAEFSVRSSFIWKNIEGSEEEYNENEENYEENDMYDFNDIPVGQLSPYEQKLYYLLKGLHPDPEPMWDHCHKKVTLYHVNWDRLKSHVDGYIQSCTAPSESCSRTVACFSDIEDCQKAFTVHHVPNTNLIFILAAKDCTCHPIDLEDTFSSETEENYTEKETCDQLSAKNDEMWKMKYGRATPCQEADEDEDEDRCGQESIKISNLLFLLSICLSLIHKHGLYGWFHIL